MAYDKWDIKSWKIGICDDERWVREELAALLSAILEQESISYEVFLFDSGLDMLEQIKMLHIVFLDMDMPILDGIELGEKIMEKNESCKIVIASGREDRYKETYKIRPIRFVSKPFDVNELREAIHACRQLQVGTERIEVFKERQSYWVHQRDIQYISAYKGYVELKVESTLYRKDISMNHMESMLSKGLFYKIHKSYIINMLWVSSIDKNEICVGGVRLPLSRRKRKDFETAYMDFDLHYR